MNERKRWGAVSWLHEIAEKGYDPSGSMSYRVRRYDGVGDPSFGLEFDELRHDLSKLFDRIAALERELADRDRRIAHLESLLPQAFDAGIARGIASHRNFEQVYPDRDAWVREALGKDEEEQ